MKPRRMSRSTLTLFISGLLLVSLTPIIARHYHVPDYVSGFLSGLGLTLEFLAVVNMQRSRTGGSCTSIFSWRGKKA
ncbi:MAG TPA: hypothetical protein VGE15_04875 [Sphingobacteriaceae bacterium]